MKQLGNLIFLMALAGILPAWPATEVPSTPERRVEGQTIVSSLLPAAKLTFANSFRYEGGQRFPLYGVADAEQHFFVDADGNGQVRRLYWVQFEHYLPDNDHHYNYTSSHTAKIGELSFLYDTEVYTDYAGLKPRPDSDVDKAFSLLSSRGLHLPHTAVRTRMFHFPGSDHRSELMIIYLEALSPDKMPTNATDQMAADEQFPSLSAAVARDAQMSLSILP